MPFVAFQLCFAYVNKALLYKQIQNGNQLFLTKNKRLNSLVIIIVYCALP